MVVAMAETARSAQDQSIEAGSTSVLVVTGEASGERYAAQVVEAFRRLETAAVRAADPAAATDSATETDSAARAGGAEGPHSGTYPGPTPGSIGSAVSNTGRVEFYGSGGEAMRSAGVELLADVARLSAIGPWEALKLLGDYVRLLRRVLREVRTRGTRLALLVDFPDFNLILSRFLRRRGVTVLYYISPTVWAWRRGRMRTIRRTVRRMLCIFPFEEPLYREAGIDAVYVGHPMMSTLPEVEEPGHFRHRLGLADDEVPIAVLPGSRHAEIRHILTPLLEALVRIKAAVPAARFRCRPLRSGIRRDVAAGIDAFFRQDRARSPRRHRAAGRRHPNVLANAKMAIVKSGTSTLQAAIAGTPFVMIYRANPAMWLLSKVLLSNRYFCIVNLIAGREVVPELLQGRLNGENLARTFLTIFTAPDIYTRMQRELAELRGLFGNRDAPQNVARQLLQTLTDTPEPTGGRP